MKERKLGLAKRLSALALALVMVFSLFSLSDLKALAAGDVAPTASDDWTYDGKGHDLIVAPGEALDDAYTLLYAVTDSADEPDAPTATNMGAWTINWKDDEQFVATDAGDYYLWWCAYDAENDSFSTEPDLLDVVSVSKAKPLGIAPTAESTVYTGGSQALIAIPGGIPLDPENSVYYYCVTAADEDDPTDYTWGTYAEAMVGTKAEAICATSVGDYKIWYQLKYTGADENVEDGELSYVTASISPMGMYIDPDDVNPHEDYSGDPTVTGNTRPDFTSDEPGFVDSYGLPVTPQQVTYALKESDLTNPKATTYNSLDDAFAKAAENKKYQAGDYKVYYMATLTGHSPATGLITCTVDKAEATVATDPASLNAEVIVSTASSIRLVTNPGAADTGFVGDKTKMYFQATQGKVPNTASLSGWTSEDDIATLTKGNDTGKWYVWYMAASEDTKNVAPSQLKYFTVTLGKDAGKLDETTISGVSAATGLKYDGTAKELLTGYPVGQTGQTIQYLVVNLDETLDYNMPAPNDSRWYTLGENEHIQKTNARTYIIWYKALQYTDNATKVTYAETTPTFKVVTIGKGDLGAAGLYTAPVAVDELTYTGRQQSVIETKGSAENGLVWTYGVDLVPYGTSIPKVKDADTYYAWWELTDPSLNYTDDGDTAIEGGAAVKVNQYDPEVVDPELVDGDLEYTGEKQSFIETAGKTDKGNLYYFVVAEDGTIVSIDGTATEAGDYEIYAVATELSASEVAVAVAQANLVGPYAREQLGMTASNLELVTVGATIGAATVPGLKDDSNIWSSNDAIYEGSLTIETIDPETVIDPMAVSTPYTGYNQDIAQYGVAFGGQIYYMAYDATGEKVWDEWTRIVPRATAQGEYTIAYRVVNVEWNYNDNFSEGTLEEVIETPSVITEGQAELLVAPVGLGLNATGLDQALASEGVAENGTVMYTLGTEEAPYPGVEWKAEVPEASEEGTYHVWYYVAGDEGFADTDPAHVDATIGHETVLYRIYNPATGEHIFTDDANEVANATQNLGWTLDGTVSGTSAGTKPVYRLMDLIHGVHVYSTDENEVATLVDAGVAKLEGVQFYTVEQGENTDDYYRLSDPTGTFPHMYSNDENEIAALVASGVYVLDGYAWSFPGTSN